MTAAKEFSRDAVPTADVLATAAGLYVYAEDGTKVTFGSLVEDGKTIVIFIRHFFCGVCKDFVTQLGTVRKEALSAAGAKLVVIGCGEYHMIPAYRADAAYPYEVYADPKKELYITLGMTKRTLAATPKGEEKKNYVKDSYLTYAVRGAISGPLSHPTQIFAAGDIAQLGGEFIFEPGLDVTFVSRMQHTADHLDVIDIMSKASVEYP